MLPFFIKQENPSWGLPCWFSGKESPCNEGDLGSTPGLGRSPGEGKGYPFQYSGLENSTDCVVYEVAKSWMRLSDFHFYHICIFTHMHIWWNAFFAYCQVIDCFGSTISHLKVNNNFKYSSEAALTTVDPGKEKSQAMKPGFSRTPARNRTGTVRTGIWNSIL